MERIRLQKGNIEEAATRAAEVLRAGGVVLYPTDTLYGLGADAFSDEAFQKVCTIKSRDKRRPIHAVFADLAMVEKYADLTPLGKALAAAFLPGPLTLVLKKKEGLTSGIGHNLETIGIRIPDNEFCLALARAFGKPYTTTSANLSGAHPEATLDEIIGQLEEHAGAIDLVIDGGPLSPSARSTVVHACQDKPHILRTGAISEEEIMQVVREEGI
jgi:L-threonylcarbamoyladenylate synthase